MLSSFPHDYQVYPEILMGHHISHVSCQVLEDTNGILQHWLSQVLFEEVGGAQLNGVL